MTFQVDTTFKICEENFKLMAPVYQHTTTNSWEVACLIFMLNEDRPPVEAGVDFFKSVLTYDPPKPWIFIVDKHLLYIDVLQSRFPGCTVLLCDVHVNRWFENNVFACKIKWESTGSI